MAKKIKVLPDVEELKKLFYIDSSIPNGLRWRIIPARRISIDDPAGSKSLNGYYQTSINGKIYRNHRIVYSIFHTIHLTGDQIVDHIDKNPQNNNPNNLRIATISENNRNKIKQKTTSSEFFGVSFHKHTKKFRARIKINKISVYLGLFLTEQEAALAYNNYIITHNLSHFNLNQI
jgi:hypothetical protein